MSPDRTPAASLVEEFHYPQVTGSAAGACQTSAADHGGLSGDAVAQRLSQVREEGIRDGEQRERKRLEQEIVKLRGSVAEALIGFERERAEYYSKIEAEVVHLAIAIAGKILHREAQMDRMLLAALVKVALEKLQQNTHVILRVPRGQSTPWREYFAQNSQTVKPEIAEDQSLAPGNCLLETELGSTEIGLESQLKELETGLFDLLAQRPEAACGTR